MADDDVPVSNAPISLADEDAVKQVVADTIFNLWDAVNNLTRLRPSRRDRYRVTIFGSARRAWYIRVRRVQAARRGARRIGLRHHYRRRARLDAGGE